MPGQLPTRHRSGHPLMYYWHIFFTRHRSCVLQSISIETLFEKAQRMSGLTERTAVIREGLKALIERESARRLARLLAGGARVARWVMRPPELAPRWARSNQLTTIPDAPGRQRAAGEADSRAAFGDRPTLDAGQAPRGGCGGVAVELCSVWLEWVKGTRLDIFAVEHIRPWPEWHLLKRNVLYY